MAGIFIKDPDRKVRPWFMGLTILVTSIIIWNINPGRILVWIAN